MNKKPFILQVPESLVVEHYPEPTQLANEQLNVIWFPDEIKVEKDIQDILVNMTPAEKHGVLTVLKLFTLYELKAGAEYWNGKFVRIFKRPEFRKMASVFGMTELAVHKPFYQKLNEALHIDTDEFYMEYVKDDVLRERMEFIDSVVSSKNDLLSLASFSMVEGGILYSAFAFLKHFQSQGKNKLLNIVRGIDMSVRDENFHSIGGAWAFCQLKKEMELSPEEEAELHAQVIEVVETIRNHEHRIAAMVFAGGDIDGITLKQMCNFIDSRLNVCLDQLGYPKHYEVTYNPIKEWFYQGINGFKFNDNFTGIGNSYVRNWDEDAFEFKEYVREGAAHE